MDATGVTTRAITIGELEEAVRLRESSITNGREAMVEAFDEDTRASGDLFLGESKRRILVGAFRRLLAENERLIKRGDDEKSLSQCVDAFLDNNDDTFDKKVRGELKQKILTFLKERKDKIAPKGNQALIERLEEFIEASSEGKGNRGLLQRLKGPKPRRGEPVTLEHDLGCIMQMILHAEIERLERTM